MRVSLVAGAVKCRTVAGALALVPANAGRAGAVAGPAGSATIYLLGFREVASGCYKLQIFWVDAFSSLQQAVIDRRFVDIYYWLVLKPPSREWVRVSLRLPKRRR